MGWATGSTLMGDIIRGLRRKNMSPAGRRMAYNVLVPAFQDYDCDTLHECEGIDKEYDKVIKRLGLTAEDDEDDDTDSASA